MASNLLAMASICTRLSRYALHVAEARGRLALEQRLRGHRVKVEAQIMSLDLLVFKTG